MNLFRACWAAGAFFILAFIPSVAPADERYLKNWLDRDLLPYLEDRLGRHPRLRGQPFEVVPARHHKEPGKIDGLTAYIQQKIVDRLQTTPGANLVLHPAVKPWRFRQNLMDMACEFREKAQVHVTIEVDDSGIAGALRIAVRAIDLSENNWVRGFSKIWIGKPTTREKQLMANSGVDRNAIGSRTLPFRSDQPDLLASYLAENLGCLLKTTGKKSIRLLVSQPSETLPGFFQTTFQLLNHYLARFKEVNITKHPKKASVILTSKVHSIDQNLFQISALFQSADDSVRILGLGSEAYVELPDSALIAVAPNKKRLLALFQLVAPIRQSECRESDPWRKGEKVLTETSRLPSDGCFALRIRSAETATLFLLSQTEDGQLTRLFPDACDVLGLEAELQNNRMRSHQAIHAPLFDNNRRGYFQLGRQAGIERVYAIATVDSGLAASFNQRLGQVSDLCTETQRQSRDDVDRFQRTLTRLEKENQGKFEWLERRFIHTRK